MGSPATPTHAVVPSNQLAQRLRQRPLLFFFLLTFGATWAYEALVFGILHTSIDEVWATLLLLLVGPAMAAFVVTAVTQVRVGVRELLRRCARWRVGLSWYLLVLLGVPALLLLPYLLQPGAFSAFHLPGLGFWLTYLVVFVATLVAGGPLAEEPGWRGFALPASNHASVHCGGRSFLACSGGYGISPSSCSSQGTMGPVPASSVS